MVLYVDKIVLLDRTAPVAWSGGDPVGSTDLPQATDPDMTQDGDMRPWRIRLELANTGVTGEINYGTLKLRMDEQMTFVNSGPLLMTQDAKKKYLIEAYIIQTDDDGSSIESKRFRFQIGTPSLDVDKNLGSVLTISLQEIQYRMKESVSSRELRFVTPKNALTARIIDFNNHQVTGVNIISTNNKLPDVEQLQQSYIPNSPQTIHILIDKIFENLSEPQVVGGVFKDFYYDFDPTASTLTVDLIADEIGRVDSGVTINPISSEAFDSNEEQSASTDFVRFKNHVIVKGTADGGSLPTEHSRYSSSWLHAKLRPEWNVSNGVTDRDGNTFAYLKGQTVKITVDTGISTISKVVRYFTALDNVGQPSSSPLVTVSDWNEDFLTYPSFDNHGSYEEDDVIYFDTGPDIRWYRAKEDIFALTLNGIRSGKDDTDPLWGAFLTVAGVLKDPDGDTAHWEDLTGSGVTAHPTTGFAGYQTYSPWTSEILMWEKNMVGLRSGSLVGVAGDNYVGLTPDWNMLKDTYDKQDITDEFETITMKWVTKVGVNDVVSSSPTNTQIDDDEKYHGNRVIVGVIPSSEFTDDYDAQFPSGTANNRLAQFDITGGVVGTGIWRFSKFPETGDFVTNLDQGNIFYWNGSAWVIGWEFERANTSDRGMPKSSGAWAHPVKDVYKVKGFEGTPSSAVEFRYVWNSGLLNDNPDSGDSSADIVKKARSASRGAWLWFWKPFPRLPVGSDEIGSLFGGNGETPSPASGFVTLNIFNNNSDRLQNLRGYNNGLNSEDMGKISGISFKLKVGIFADGIEEHNDLDFRKLGFAIIGLESVAMIFWALDNFDRIWFKRFSLRRNNEWDSVQIEFGDLSQKNMYLPRWDELRNLMGIPLSALNFLLKQREYTGVQFDWRFVKGWGIMLADGYDDTGFYNGGIDSKRDLLDDVISQIKHGLESAYVQLENAYEGISTLIRDGIEEARKLKFDVVTTTRVQSTIAIDDLYYVKELVVNSDSTTVTNGRTSVEYNGTENDYIIAKALAIGKRERLSFYPQFWHFRSIGNVKIRVGQNFTVTGDRIPDNADQYQVWNAGTAYNAGESVGFNGIAYRALTGTSAGQSPTSNPTLWDNLNLLACSSIKHIVDGNGYHIEVDGRRKFITTGE